jgi:probable F420-dependent oxidoreductase
MGSLTVKEDDLPGGSAVNAFNNGNWARTRLGPIGIWSLELRFGDSSVSADAAAELDELGFGALWIPGGVGGDVLGSVDKLFGATRNAVIATGIINIWKHDAREIGNWWSARRSHYQPRVMLGLGVSHGPLIGDTYSKPLAAMRKYLADLSKEGVPAMNMCVAALRRGMLDLARELTAGAHPYLVTPEHTAMARSALGPNALLAPEQGVLLETDPWKARESARRALKHYRDLPNYVSSWHRLGFTEDDIATLSNRLIDGLFAWGGVAAIADRVKAHLAAGADHVCLQVISDSPRPDVEAIRPAWRELAAALL